MIRTLDRIEDAHTFTDEDEIDQARSQSDEDYVLAANELSVHGISAYHWVVKLDQGKTYDLPASQEASLIDMGLAEEV